jgi:hypothetical protein
MSLFCFACAYAQVAGDRGTTSLDLSGGKVTVEYGRPALRDRDLEAMIQPGLEWRMGSNDPTTLTTDVALKFGDKSVPPGKYTLTAKVTAPREWVLKIEGDSSSTEVPFKFQKVEKSVDLLTISLEKAGGGGRFVLHWGTLTLSADFRKA